MTTTLALRHVAFEDLGTLGAVLGSRGHTLDYVDVPTVDLGTIDPLACDLLVVLGGPIGAYEDDDYPFLGPETKLIDKRLAAGRPTLGICLGSQLMARALGARVYRNAVKEIGWAPLELTREGGESCLRHLADTAVLHWHGDTFDLPDGAVRLASTPACENQAFGWGTHALALQFHAEAAGRPLERWLVGHTAEIAATHGVSVAALRADTAEWSPRIARAGRLCFEAWLSQVGL